MLRIVQPLVLTPQKALVGVGACLGSIGHDAYQAEEICVPTRQPSVQLAGW